jgi:hypothetical protein
MYYIEYNTISKIILQKETDTGENKYFGGVLATFLSAPGDFFSINTRTWPRSSGFSLKLVQEIKEDIWR